MKIFSVGVFLSFVYFVIITITLCFLKLNVMSSWNELGDFLAGAFSPVAFLWLVLGYLQQQKELQLNTEALKLQADELKNSVDQYKKMVKIAQEQLSHELSKIQEERFEKEIRTRPDIRLQSLRFQSRTGNSLKFRPFVLSDGREARNVTIEFPGGFGNYSTCYKDIVKENFTMPEALMQLQELPEEVEVIISFESAIGIKYRYQYIYFNKLDGVYQSVRHKVLNPE